MAIIQIPVLFDMSGDTLVFGEEISDEFISSHLDFLLDMTTEANDISLNAADISSAILVGDQDDGDNIFYSGGETSNIAVDNLCNRIAKSITRGKLVHIPKTGNSSNSGIPMGGRLYVVRADGQEEVPPDGQYASKYLHSIASVGDEQMLGGAMARVTSVHLMGTPLAAAILVDKNSVQSDLETTSGQTFNSGNTAFYNALAVQLSKVLGGSKSSAPMNKGISIIATGGNLASQIYHESFDNEDVTLEATHDVTYITGRYGGKALSTIGNSPSGFQWVQRTSNSTLPASVKSVSFHIKIPAYAGSKAIFDNRSDAGSETGDNQGGMMWLYSNALRYYSNTRDTYGTASGSGFLPTGDQIYLYVDGVGPQLYQTTTNGGNGTRFLNITTSGTASGKINICDNNWHHFYIEYPDGETPISAFKWLALFQGGYNLEAAIDEVRFFNAALTTTQIQSLITGGSGASTTSNYPLDASGTSVPALKSIYEQLMNVPGRSQIMPTRDISDGVQDNSNTTLTGGFPFISGDKLVMYLRPKIQFAAQTQAEDNNALYTFNYTGKTILAIPAYSISDKTGIITTQTYTHSSSQNSTGKIFEHSTDGNGIIGAEFWHSAANSYNNTTGVHEGENANGATTNVDIATSPPATTTTHTVTVGDNGGNKFKIDGAFNPILAFVKGNTYIFDQSDGTNSGHQIQISETSGGANTSYATTVGTPGTAGAKTTVVVPTNAPGALYYNCNTHGAGMGNSIGVTSPPNSISGEWGQVDIGENTWATELKLTSNNGNNDSPPREFRLLASTNGTNWITLIHETEAGPWADQVTQTFPIVTQGSYRYYRYIVIKCYNAVSAGNINSQTTIGHFNLRGAKHPSETAENSDLAFMNNSPLDISGLQTNVVSASASVQSAFPGNATNGPEAEAGKWGWMGSANSDSFTLDSTDFVDPRTIDLHIWKITITL
jgi:hypothetical protein